MKLSTTERSAKYLNDILQRYKSLAGFARYLTVRYIYDARCPTGVKRDLYHIANESYSFISHFTK